MIYQPRDSVVIYRTKNGYVAEIHGDRCNQEDNIGQGSYSFESFNKMFKTLRIHFGEVKVNANG